MGTTTGLTILTAPIRTIGSIIVPMPLAPCIRTPNPVCKLIHYRARERGMRINLLMNNLQRYEQKFAALQARMLVKQ